MFQISEDDEMTVPTAGTLIEEVEAARAEQLAARDAADFTKVNIWLTEPGFVSPYPDRVRVVDISREDHPFIELLRNIVDYMDQEKIAGYILAIPDQALATVLHLADKMNLELGYMPNPDYSETSATEWSAWTNTVRELHPLDIPAVYEPLHLPDSADLLEPPAGMEEKKHVEEETAE